MRGAPWLLLVSPDGSLASSIAEREGLSLKRQVREPTVFRLCLKPGSHPETDGKLGYANQFPGNAKSEQEAQAASSS